MRRFVFQIGLFVLLAGVLGAVNAWLNPAVPHLGPPELPEGHITLATALEWAEQAETPVLWVDARSAAAYEQGHIPGALLCNEGDYDAGLGRVLEAVFAEVQQPKMIVYCDSRQCGSSTAVASRLQADVPEAQIWVLHEGWEAWVRR